MFFDVDAIGLATDFVQEMEAGLASAEVVIVVIGRGWLTAADDEGGRRLDDPEDLVRKELATALERKVPMIPVLVGGAVMPKREQLPASLGALTRWQALTISHLDWGGGRDRLLAKLRQLLGATQVDDPDPDPHDGGLARGAMALGGAALLLLGTALRFDQFANPDFGAGNAPHLGLFTSLPPLGVAVGAVGALALVHTRPGRVSAGLLLGFALAGVAKYAGSIAMSAAAENPEESQLVVGAILALAGSALLAAYALWRASDEPEQTADGAYGAPRALAAVGAVLAVAGTLIPFNDGPAFAEAQVLIERANGWEAFDPIACAVCAAVAASLLTHRRAGLLAAGALVGLGLSSALLWLRYVAVPILQPDDVSSPAAGAFVGLAGASAILLAGLISCSRATRTEFAGGVPAGRPT